VEVLEVKPVVNVINLFFFVIDAKQNKLERLPVATFFKLVSYLLARREAYTQLGYEYKTSMKNFPETNTLAYSAFPKVRK
jgi:hypothetical protein